MSQLLETSPALQAGSYVIESGKGAVNIDGSIVRLSELNLPVRFVVGTATGNVGSITAIGSSVAIYRSGTATTGQVSTTDAHTLNTAPVTVTGTNQLIAGSGQGKARVTQTIGDDTNTFTLNLNTISYPFLLSTQVGTTAGAAGDSITVEPLGSSFFISR